MSTKAPHIASLTPLRGIAAVLVIFYHTDSLLRAQHLGRLVYGTGFFARGYLWVDFFFVLSGFIITHVYGSQFTPQISATALRDYLLARFARLYPLYLFALCVTVFLFIAVLHRMPNAAMFYSWKTLPFHFLMLLGFNLVPMGWNVPAWSIGAEWWTYLLAVPLFRFLNRGVSGRAFVLPVLCAVALYALVFFHPRHVLDITFDFGLLRCVLDFVIGICVYQFYRARWQGRFLATDGAFALAALLTVALLHFAAPGDPPAEARGFASPVPSPLAPVLDALSPLIFAGVILSASLNGNRARHLLNARPLQYLGDISYSVYMMQGTALTLFFVGCGAWRQSHPLGSMDSLTKIAIVGTTVIADLLLAAATYRWIEIPARVWLRRKFTPADATFD